MGVVGAARIERREFRVTGRLESWSENLGGCRGQTGEYDFRGRGAQGRLGSWCECGRRWGTLTGSRAYGRGWPGTKEAACDGSFLMVTEAGSGDRSTGPGMLEGTGLPGGGPGLSHGQRVTSVGVPRRGPIKQSGAGVGAGSRQSSVGERSRNRWLQMRTGEPRNQQLSCWLCQQLPGWRQEGRRSALRGLSIVQITQVTQGAGCPRKVPAHPAPRHGHGRPKATLRGSDTSLGLSQETASALPCWLRQ